MSPPSGLPVLPRPQAAPFLLGGGRSRAAVETCITGVVQGVGFRPFVHRLALRYGLAGWVRNEAGAVRIRLEGPGSGLDAFAEAVRTELPPLARIDGLTSTRLDPEGFLAFQVVESETSVSGRLPVSPDVATCATCEAELRDPTNERYRYPFITCTDCGPRFTVIEEMPYDRVRTTMRAFRQCPSCAGEYEAPMDRRYHSETNSCPVCGPSVWLHVPGTARAGGTGPSGFQAIEALARLLLDGKIVALRGLGGFHLAVRADDEAAVTRLRRRKAREQKPLALMVRDVEAVRRLAHLGREEEAQLTSRQRPIVILRLVDAAEIAPSVAPGLGSVGVMLPYTPLHHLLMDEVGGVPLVMTSGNLSDEPIAIGNDEALACLSTIADAFLLHDREIVARYDDSVLRVAEVGPVLMRRSRGFAPMPVPLPIAAPHAILAVGPHLKNTFTLAQGTDAFVSQHIGDLDSLETSEHFHDARSRFETLFRIEPRWVVRDLHPGYMSTALAEDSGLPQLPPVQHHHAHVAAVMGEHGARGPVLGLAFDGTGYGTDGRVWGCEFLLADLTAFRRVAHLRYAPLPGGDAAVRAPWRALLGYATLDGWRPGLGGTSSGLGGRGPGGGGRRRMASRLPGWAAEALVELDPTELGVASRQVERSVNAPPASSLGRLFDAVAALLGIRRHCGFEGQAAMELEAAAGTMPGRALPFPVRMDRPGDEAPPVRVLDPLPLLKALAEGLRDGRSVAGLAADFHETLTKAAVEVTLALSAEADVDVVALGGGCFQNVRLLDGVAGRLADHGLEVLVPRRLGPNDGAISYGQAVVAAARLAEEE